MERQNYNEVNGWWVEQVGEQQVPLEEFMDWLESSLDSDEDAQSDTNSDGHTIIDIDDGLIDPRDSYGFNRTEVIIIYFLV